jgi:acyl-CoA reductase-like NAD-dependent aldehyde dehydrogenase/nicotinamidase-related amidase
MAEAPARTALVLVDLQGDFLASPGLAPDADTLAARAAALLAAFRARGLPVAHAHTRVAADGADAMPHWRRRAAVPCREGSAGAEPPAALAPIAGECVARKRFYGPFADPGLEAWLRARGVERLVVAGCHLHACVRQTVLEAYERGYQVVVADDAVATPEPLHGALTRAWLAERFAAFRSAAEIVAELDGKPPAAREGLPAAWIAGAARPARAGACFVHRDPCDTARVLAEVPLAGADEVAHAARVAETAQRAWAADTVERRASLLEAWAGELDADRERLVERLVREVAKPRRFAEEEVARAAAHARVAAALVRAAAPLAIAPGVRAELRPVGVVGLVTPWNNPVAIPVGKLAPALGFGNGVVWKPAPQAPGCAQLVLEALARAGAPAGLANAVFGAADAAHALCREPRVAALALTGSSETGRVVAGLCAAALKPLQAELGGNNAAIVLADADLAAAAADLAQAAFGFAGQRCTAIRRVVVAAEAAARFEALFAEAARALRVGDPADAATDVGPLVSAEKRDRVLAAIARARREGARLVTGGEVPPGLAHGAWLAPTLLADAAPASAIVQEEGFAPVAVLQTARDLDEALALANGVAHGLLASVHTSDPGARGRLGAALEAGIVQLAPGPLRIDARAPFVGWKASGLGPPEHGLWDAAFYARTQAVYGPAPC